MSNVIDRDTNKSILYFFMDNSSSGY